ncbi:MAG: hypothetical protein BWY84_01040 [Candidatus Aerophobetes bacterium ADurb.Bin490]|nr:MAG: hypothetical protein BWY84_01040 [Candidatus Aerophobetes bacterium ADurb.Bin490]
MLKPYLARRAATDGEFVKDGKFPLKVVFVPQNFILPELTLKWPFASACTKPSASISRFTKEDMSITVLALSFHGM